jgi:flavorubredoxin
VQTPIHTNPLGSTNCFVLQAESAILIDTGGPKKASKFRRDLEKIGLSPRDI